MATECQSCGTADGVGACLLCDACIAERTDAERAAQGLEPTVTDPAVLDRIATVVRPATQTDAA